MPFSNQLTIFFMSSTGKPPPPADQTQPHPTRPDQTRPDPTRPDQTRPEYQKLPYPEVPGCGTIQLSSRSSNRKVSHQFKYCQCPQNSFLRSGVWLQCFQRQFFLATALFAIGITTPPSASPSQPAGIARLVPHNFLACRFTRGEDIQWKKHIWRSQVWQPVAKRSGKLTGGN